MSDIIKSISYDQDELLQWIIRLYIEEGRFDIDPTFSTGGFYRKIPQPKLCYDLVPQKDGVLQADCRKLPIKSGSVRSIIIDPPFLATTGKSLQSNNGNIINRRFSVARSERELAALYEDAIQEANRVLCPGGILVFKCQDKVSSGKQHMMHCNVYQWAILQGFEVPDEFENQLIEALQDENIMRGLVHVISTSSGDRKIPLVTNYGTASWIEEEAQIPESDVAFNQITLGAHKLATAIRISQELLNDSAFDLASFIAHEFQRRAGAAEEEAILAGDGSHKPIGLLHDTLGAQVGVTAASATAITADELIDLQHSLKSGYRRKAAFIMNDATIKAIRKLKDGQGQVRL